MGTACLDTLVGLSQAECACLEGEGEGNGRTLFTMESQSFLNQQGVTLTWTAGGGLIPVPTATYVHVYQNGQKLSEGAGQYAIEAETAPGEATITINPLTHTDGDNYEVFAFYATYNVSDSGYYLDDPEHGYPILESALANAQCASGSIWDILAKAREDAIRDLKYDLVAVLKRELRTGYYAWSGVMGETKANRAAAPGRDFAGLLLRPKKRSLDAYFVVTGLYAGFSHTGTVDVTIGSNTIGWTGIPLTLNTTAGKFVKTALPTPIAIPLHDPAQGGLAYSITYETAGKIPLLNRAHCNCGGRPGWTNNLEVTGWKSDIELADIDTSYIPRLCLSQWQGLAVEGYFTCMNLDFLCRLDVLGEADMLSLLGRAIQYKAAIRLMLQDQATNKVNQFSLLNADSRAARIKGFQNEYFNILQYVADNMPTGSTSCWGCSKRQPTVALAAV
jgi:hypothetical protein